MDIPTSQELFELVGAFVNDPDLDRFCKRLDAFGDEFRRLQQDASALKEAYDNLADDSLKAMSCLQESAVALERRADENRQKISELRDRGL